MNSPSEPRVTLRQLAFAALVFCMAPLAGDRWAAARLRGEEARAERIRAQAEQEAAHVRALESAFASQVHAWKNMLLRGANPPLLDAATGEFDSADAAVERELSWLREQPAPAAVIAQLIEAHRALSQAYRAAFAGGSTSDLTGLQAIDAAVRGRDRPVDAAFREVAAQVLGRSAAEEKEGEAIVARAQAEADAVRLAAVIAALLGLGAIFGGALRVTIRRLRIEVDARRAAEESQRATAAEFKQIFDTMQGIYIRSALDGRVLLVNPDAVRTLGYASEEELLGKHMGRDVFASSEVREQVLKKVLAQGRADIARATFKRKDGSTLEVEINIHTRVDREGKVIGVEGFAIDITPRLRAEAEARAADEMFRSVFERMNDAYVRGGTDGTIQLVNPAMVRLLGYSSAAELVGKNMARDVYTDLADRSALIERLRKDGHAENFRARWKRADGSSVMVESNVRLERNEQGDPIAINGLLRDVTARVQYEEELVRAREAAEAASQIKSQFLANMSHEIRTPMNAIVGLSQIALQLELPSRARDYLRTIHSSAQALLGLLNDILDFSKIEAGMLVLESSAFELDRLLEDLSNSIAVKAEEKHIELLFSVAEDVPPTLIGDPLRLSQVLLNLVSNGVKFTESGGEVVVSIGLAARNGDRVSLRCAVRDTGIGLRDDQLGQLFKPFNQGDNATTRRHGGTGLGLAISQDLVRRMGGVIEVESAPGRGSTFAFTVELGVGKGSARALPFPDLRGLRVLVVDDNKTSREILERSLASLTFQVRTVASGAQALGALAEAEAKGAPFELVLLDWQMPEMDGFEVARRIRSDARFARRPLVFMITAFGRQEMQEKAGDLVPDALLVKPLSRSALIDALMRALSGTREPATSAPVRAAWAGTGGGARVLVVEDNEVNRQVVSELLEIGGFAVETVASGREALERLERSPEAFAVVLMDVQMPEMDGYQTARAIRSQLKLSLPIVALTAHAFESERQRSLDAGMNDHVTKPIDAEGLIAALKRWTTR